VVDGVSWSAHNCPFTLGGDPLLEDFDATTSFRGNLKMTKRLLAAIAIAVVGPLGAVSTAQADNGDNKFLAAMKSEGITDHVSSQHAIEAAHSVCQKLDGGENPTQVANDVLNSSSMPAYHAGYFVGASIDAYCPQYAPKVTGGGT
jgi:hypothetical protein